MADDPNLRPSTSRSIATDGIGGGGSPIAIATRGFLSPILGDLVLGGEAVVVFSTGALITGGEANVNITLVANAVGGLVIDGQAGVSTGFTYVGSGLINIDGAAAVSTSLVGQAGGDIVTGGTAGVTVCYTYVGDGTIIIDGQAGVPTEFSYIGDGTITTGGEADADLEKKKSGGGRGGFFEYPHFGLGGMPVKKRELSPMEYLRLIQKILADENDPKTFEHTASGGVKTKGRAATMVVIRGGNSEVQLVIKSPQAPEKTAVSVPSFFKNGTTPEEIAEFEDRLLLSDSLGLGDYEFSTGEKSRFISKAVPPKENALQIGSKTEVQFVDRLARQILEEDHMLLGLGDPVTQEQEDLELLGILNRKKISR